MVSEALYWTADPLLVPETNDGQSCFRESRSWQGGLSSARLCANVVVFPTWKPWFQGGTNLSFKFNCVLNWRDSLVGKRAGLNPEFKVESWGPGLFYSVPKPSFVLTKSQLKDILGPNLSFQFSSALHQHRKTRIDKPFLQLCLFSWFHFCRRILTGEPKQFVALSVCPSVPPSFWGQTFENTNVFERVVCVNLCRTLVDGK